MSSDTNDKLIKTITINYHSDHKLVKALQNTDDPNHMTAWKNLIKEAHFIVRRAGVGWSSDTAVDPEDLEQIALTQLARNIHTFRYQSRFSTWIVQVILQSIRRAIRDSLMQKRSIRPDHLDTIPETEMPTSEAELLEKEAEAKNFISAIEQILSTEGDQRLAEIFKLSVIDDLSTEEIGRIFDLSTSRIRVLLARARDILRDHPVINAWKGETVDQRAKPN